MAGAPPLTGSPPPTSYLPTGDEPTVRYDAARAHPTAPSSPAAGHGAPPTVGAARRRGAIAAIIGGVCLIVVLAIAVIVLATRGPSEQTASPESVQVLPTPTEAVTTDATAAGMQLGDVIVAVDSDPVNGYGDLIAAMKARLPGDACEITVVRGGSTIQMQVFLDASD